MIYGNPIPIIVRDVTDLIGIRTLLLRQKFQPTGNSPSDIDAAKPSVPSVPGGVMLMGTQILKEQGVYSMIWTFQGINGDGKSVTFKDRKNSIDYGFDPGFAQVPIQMHTDFMQMIDRYQGGPGNDGVTVSWPAELGNSGTKSGLQKNDNSAGQTNPMYGIQSFFEMEGTYRYRYAERNLPANLYEGVGYIADNVPGTPPKLQDGRNLLKAPPTWERKGVVYDVTEFYWLSRRGGWPEPVYRKGHFSK